MASPASISVKQLTAAAKSSAAKALQQHRAILPTPDYTVGFIPPYWWLDIVIRNPDSKLTLVDAQKLATDVQSGVANSIAPLRSGTGAIIFVGGHVTVGFAPPPDVTVTEE